MKNLLFALFLFSFLLLACDDEPLSPDCQVYTCWDHGDFNTNDCSCDCASGFQGADCAEYSDFKVECLAVSDYVVDFVATADQADLTEVDGIPYLLANTNPYRTLECTNLCDSEVTITNAKGSFGGIVPSFPKDPIAVGSTVEIEIRYDTKLTGERHGYVDINTTEGDLRIAVTARIAE